MEPHSCAWQWYNIHSLIDAPVLKKVSIYHTHTHTYIYIYIHIHTHTDIYIYILSRECRTRKVHRTWGSGCGLKEVKALRALEGAHGAWNAGTRLTPLMNRSTGASIMIPGIPGGSLCELDRLSPCRLLFGQLLICNSGNWRAQRGIAQTTKDTCQSRKSA